MYNKLFQTKFFNEFSKIKISNIDGVIPKNLKGTYYKNGAMNLERDGKRLKHWFDGDGAILKIKISNSEVETSYKFVETEMYKSDNKNGKFSFVGISDMPSNYLDRWRLPAYINRANTSVLPLENKLLSLHEGGRPYAHDLESLETKGEDFLGKMNSQMAFTAHPKVDPDTGEIYNIGSSLEKGSKKMYLYKLNKSGDIIMQEEYSSKNKYYPLLLHDMCIAGDYLVFITMPIRIKLFEAIFKLKPLSEFLYMDKDGYNEIFIYSKKDLKLVKSIKTSPFFYYHYANGFVDDTGNLIIDLIKYPPNLKMFSEFPIRILDGTMDTFDFESTLVRMTINLKDSTINQKVLMDLCEFPTVRASDVGKKHDFILSTYLKDSNKRGIIQHIAKLDLKKNILVKRELENYEYAGESVHVQDDKREYIFNVIYDGNRHKSQFRILDFETLEDVARFDLPELINFGFHGKWKKDN